MFKIHYKQKATFNKKQKIALKILHLNVNNFCTLFLFLVIYPYKNLNAFSLPYSREKTSMTEIISTNNFCY